MQSNKPVKMRGKRIYWIPVNKTVEQVKEERIANRLMKRTKVVQPLMPIKPCPPRVHDEIFDIAYILANLKAST